MKNHIVSLFPISLCLAVLLTLSACRSPYPPTVYDVSKRRLSHYENNYFIKILPGYTLFQSRLAVTPILREYVQTVSDNIHYIFNKGDRTVVGFFRLKRQIDPSFWFRIIETAKKGKLIVKDTPLIKNIINQFEMDSEFDNLKLNTRKNYLLVDTNTELEKNRINLKIAMQPYATYKGGLRDSLFIAFMLYLPPVAEDVIQKDFEVFLENTVLSYFLNYERTLEKDLSFN